MLKGLRNRPRRRALRTVLVTIACVTVAGAVAAWLLGNHYKRLIRKELPAAISQATDNLYLVTIEDVHVNLLTRHLTVDGIHLWADPKRLEALRVEGKNPPAIADITIPELQVQGARWYKRKDGRHIDLKRLWLGQPRLQLTINPRDSTPSDFRPLHDAADKLAGIRIGSIAFEEPQITVTNLRDAEPWQSSIGGGKMELLHFEYKPGAITDSSRLLNSEAIVGYVRNWQWMRRSGGWYRFGCDSLRLSTTAGQLDMRNFTVKPAISKDALYAAAGHRMEIYTAAIASLRVEGFSLQQLVRRKTLETAVVSFGGASLDIYYNRQMPKRARPIRGTFPQQLLAGLPLRISLPRTKLDDCAVSYTELSEITGLPATISFKDVDGTVANVSNMPAHILRQPTCIASLSGHFQERTDIDAELQLNLADSACAFSLHAKLGSVEAVQINNPARAWAKVEVHNLKVNGMTLDIRGNLDSSSSTATLLYERLKLKVKAVDSITRQLRSRPFISLMANKLLLFPSNPLPGESIRTVQAFAIPEPGEPFLHLVWRHIFQAGARSTIHDEGMLEALSNRKERRAYKAEHGRRRFFRNLFPKRRRQQ